MDEYHITPCYVHYTDVIMGAINVSNHQPHDCLLNRLFRRRSKKTSKLRVTGLCAGNSPGTGEFPAQMASDAENVSIWWRHHEMQKLIQVLMSMLFQLFFALNEQPGCADEVVTSIPSFQLLFIIITLLATNNYCSAMTIEVLDHGPISRRI